MARKKRQRFSAVKAVKAAARNTIGAPPPARVEPGSPKRKPREKHKTTLEKLLSDD